MPLGTFSAIFHVWQSKSLTRLDSQNKAMKAGSPPAKSANGTLLEDRLEGLRKRNAESPGHEERMRKPEEDGCRDTIIAVAHTFLPSWLSMASVLALIFGGCCANVFALEAIIQAAPNSGTLITATQFLLTSLITLSSHLDLSRGVRHLYLRQRSIPFRRWLIYTAFFLTINTLNNAAFGYKISVPLHIILRSAGPVATMAVGYFSGKQYTRLQALAV